MRITPFAVWAKNLDIESLRIACNMESRLTHINPFALEACFLYCVAIKHLLENVENENIKDKC